MRPDPADLPAAALLAFPNQQLSHPGNHQAATCTRWNESTRITAFGNWLVIAFLNAADGSIATTSIRFRGLGCGTSQPPTAVESRPSTMPRT